jgi:hypothetical protein
MITCNVNVIINCVLDAVKWRQNVVKFDAKQTPISGAKSVVKVTPNVDKVDMKRTTKGR